MDLANQLIKYATENAVQEAGGDKSQVGWINHKWDSQFQKKQAPPAAAKPHQMVRCRRDYCQMCFKDTDNSLPEEDRRGLCTFEGLRCDGPGCKMRMCIPCAERRHGQMRVQVPVEQAAK